MTIHYRDNRMELLNLAEDPVGTTDLSVTFPEKTKEFKKVLDKKLSESGAQFATLNPGYKSAD